MNLQTVLSRMVFLVGAIVLLGLIAGMGVFFFFVMLGLLASVALYNVLRNSGIMGTSRDSAFAFEKEDFRAQPNPPPPVIEGEYRKVEPSEEEKS